MAPAPRASAAPLWLAVGLTLLTLAAYGGVQGLGYVEFDDPQYVARNEVVLRGATARDKVLLFAGHEENDLAKMVAALLVTLGAP